MKARELKRKTVELEEAIEAYRASLRHLGNLERDAERMRLKSHQLEQAAEKAHIAASAAMHDLELARQQERQIETKEEKVRQLQID